MPTGAYVRRRENPPHPTPNRDLTEEERLAQLQQVIAQNTNTNTNTNANDDGDGNDAGENENENENENEHAGSTTPPTDGARNPIAPGADYASLRLLTRRQPKDSEAVLAGLDTTNADLSWTAGDGTAGTDPNGQPWLYPKKRGRGEGSNLDQFKDEIEERTRDGQGCKAIADAMIAKGVDTSSRAVARQRMKWGLRQRAPRRMTAQGIANIRKAHLEQAKRLANSDPVPVKRVRIRVMRKAEITRMTKEGMSSAQIADNLIARGVKLKRGAATVERLRTVWGLTEDTQRSVNNIRATARSQALRHQKEQFENIARELGIADVDAWVENKMDEEVAQDARREYAYKLMGDARPKLVSPEQLRRNAEHLRQLKQVRRSKGSVLTKMPGVDFVPMGSPGFSPAASPGDPGVASTSAEGTPAAVAEAGALLGVIEVPDDDEDDDDDTEDDEMDGEADAADESADIQQPQTTPEPQQQSPTAMEVDSLASMQAPILHDTSAVQPNGAPPQSINVTSDPTLNSIVFYNGYEGPHPTTGSAQQQVPANVTTAPPAGLPGRPPSFVNIVPRPIAPRPLAPRAIAPQPLAPLSFHPHKAEADYMAQFGLFPYPAHHKPPQKYLTPTGLITTDGYEYLASPPPPPGIGQSPLPPPPKVSKIPAPPLVMPLEEIEKHKSDFKTIEGYQKTAQECLDILAARANRLPLANSLTGLPPSLRDIQNAKEKLKETANALLAEL